MRFQFLNAAQSALADSNPALPDRLKAALADRGHDVAVTDPGEADVILLKEPPSYKDWRYPGRLAGDPLVGRFAQKIWTVNGDDAGSGLLRGVYTSLPARRFDARRHRAVPWAEVANGRVLERRNEASPPKKFLAGWRGNPKSNRLRRDFLKRFAGHPRICAEASEGWFNHEAGEKDRYVDLLLSSKFSLCPAGFGPVTFRVYESMALGLAPVIVASDFILPEGPDWAACSITVEESRADELETILAQREDEAAEMGARARQEWERYFSPEKVDGYYTDALLDLMQNAPPTSREAEIKRWTSFRMRWTNKWTIPQRVENRIRRLFRRK